MQEKIPQRLILRLMAREPSWIEKAMADPERTLDEIEESTTPAGFAKATPSVSVQPRSLIFVKFLSEGVQRGEDRFHKPMVWADVEILADTPNGYFEKKPKTLKAGDKASINLGRHMALLRGAKSNAPLTGKCFCIANLGKKPTSKGNTASDYRWKQIDCPED